ncbi:hypothetical protein CEP54_002840 [Fusarium duplospermum]|uniref:MYND-type domain-containing protein n=1 Tax=Fusarium duplospermum TaxID=1325734 RepID=A0A428QSP1_9HYPO|nr:hypothetical protein CEP54_002840 [Fusarium duplospermum]
MGVVLTWLAIFWLSYPIKGRASTLDWLAGSSCAGCNILHTDDAEYFGQVIDDIARELLAYAEGDEDRTFTIWRPLTEDRELVAEMLGNGLLDAILEEIVARYMSSPCTLGAGRYTYILAVIAAMKVGAIIAPVHFEFAKAFTPHLVSPFHQLQVLTACEEYKNNGKRWVFEAMYARTISRHRTRGARGDPRLGNGLGHSVDEPPTRHCCSKTCITCGSPNPRIICKGCRIFRYCSKGCLEHDRKLHKETCPARPYDGSFGAQWYME